MNQQDFCNLNEMLIFEADIFYSSFSKRHARNFSDIICARDANFLKAFSQGWVTAWINAMFFVGEVALLMANRVRCFGIEAMLNDASISPFRLYFFRLHSLIYKHCESRPCNNAEQMLKKFLSSSMYTCKYIMGARWHSGKQFDPYWIGVNSIPAAAASFPPQRQAAQY